MTKTIECYLYAYWSKCYLPAYISGAMLFISESFVCSVFRAICLWIQILGVLCVLCHLSRSILDRWHSTQSTPRLWKFSSVKYSNLIKSCSTNQVRNTQLTRHRSFTCQWILGVQLWCVLHLHHHPLVCSACSDIHHSRQSAFKHNIQFSCFIATECL